jgi:protein pelota
MLAKEDGHQAWYGPDHVSMAIERGYVDTLLISDDLFRASDPTKRTHYVQMVEMVRDGGGQALIFSSMHESGQQLNQYTGIAAILRFPLDPEIVEREALDEKEESERLGREKNDLLDRQDSTTMA